MNIKYFIEQNRNMLHQILDGIKVGIWITDDDGTVIFVNSESEKTGGLTESYLLGKKMTDLINIGYIVDESSVLKALKSGQESSIIQQLGDGGYIYATSVPVKTKTGERIIVCTERDITETMNLRKILEEKESKESKYISEIEHLRNAEIEKSSKIIAASQAMHNVYEMARRIAKINTTVLITGESGTGKEVIANAIYDASERNGKPFIKVNCSAIPENLMESEFFGYEKGAFTGANRNGKSGFFEMAHGGVLFLDEIGDLPISMQPKLLRAIQEREIMRIGGANVIEIDVRIIAATNVDLQQQIQLGNFREDLYYRLNVMSIAIPSLCKRKDDIPALASLFLDEANKKFGLKKVFAQGAISKLMEYDWPGNVRELRNVVEQLAVSTDTPEISKFQIAKRIFPEFSTISKSLKQNVLESASLKSIMSDFECEVLSSYLEKYGTAAAVAKVLKVDKSTIGRKLKRYNLL